MRVVLAPDSFKGSLSAAEAADAMRAGVLAACPDADVVCIPMADGGEGTAEALRTVLGGEKHTVEVTGPNGRPRSAEFVLVGRTAVLDSASACGLTLLSRKERDIMTATTAGVGDLIQAARAAGASRIIVGLGGSGTNDGGAGMLMRLGARIEDAGGHPVGWGPAGLAHARRVVLPDLPHGLIEVACDVDNPLLGPSGASAMFGPQKGARARDVVRLESILAHLASLLDAARGADVAALTTAQCGCDEAAGLASLGADQPSLADIPGAGAAGGMGMAFVALGARLRPGVQVVAETLGLADAIAGADLVMTGEGRIDAQTLRGKTPAGVADLARTAGVPVIAIGGTVSDVAQLADHFSAIVSATPRGMDERAAIRGAATYLRVATARAVRDAACR